VSRVRVRSHWPVTQHLTWRGPHREHLVRRGVYQPLLSTGHGADHIENTSSNTFPVVACAYYGRCLEMCLYVTISLCNLFLGLPSDLFLTDIQIKIISTSCAISLVHIIFNDYINLVVFGEVCKYYKTLNHEMLSNILISPPLLV
jgi:hypothetical protein